MNLDRRRLFAALAGAASATAATPALARKSELRDAVTLPQGSEFHGDSRRRTANRDRRQFARAAAECRRRSIQGLAARHRPCRGRARGAAPAAGFLPRRRLAAAAHTAIAGVPGATRIVMSAGPSMHVGHRQRPHQPQRPYPRRRRHPAARAARPHPSRARPRACALPIASSSMPGRNGITLEAIEGEVTGNTISAADNAIFSIDAARPANRRQYRARRRQWRHPGLAHHARRRRHARHRQPHRRHRQQSRRLRPIRQRHQCVSRRQRHRARQPHPQCGVLGGARQRGVQPANRRQYLHRPRRGRALCRIRLRGRGDRQQYRRRRGTRRLGDELQRRRPARRGARQPDPQSRRAAAPPAPIRTTAPASASASRPTPWSTGNVVENVQGIGIAAGWGPYLRDVAVTSPMSCAAPITASRFRSRRAPARR